MRGGGVAELQRELALARAAAPRQQRRPPPRQPAVDQPAAGRWRGGPIDASLNRWMQRRDSIPQQQLGVRLEDGIGAEQSRVVAGVNDCIVRRQRQALQGAREDPAAGLVLCLIVARREECRVGLEARPGGHDQGLRGRSLRLPGSLSVARVWLAHGVVLPSCASRESRPGRPPRSGRSRQAAAGSTRCRSMKAFKSRPR